MPRPFGTGNAGRPPKKKRTPCFSNRNGTGKKRGNLKRRAVKLSQEQDWEGNSIYDTALEVVTVTFRSLPILLWFRVSLLTGILVLLVVVVLVVLQVVPLLVVVVLNTSA